MQVRTVDDNNRPLASGKVGELQVKSITVMRTYLGQDTSDTLSEEGWLSTGDIGFVDEHQMIHIVDRKKDVINRAGENISAAEVESCISLFPGVTEVAVVGCPDEALGECVVAVIYTPLGDALDTEAVLSYCREHLASFKVPCKILVSASPLPRNPAGKLLKNLIKEYYLHPGQAVGASV
jgi:long-chain acyl-CoA synthetase